VTELREFMRGLVEAAPASGHRTPAVVVSLRFSVSTRRPCARTFGSCSRCSPPECTVFSLPPRSQGRFGLRRREPVPVSRPEGGEGSRKDCEEAEVRLCRSPSGIPEKEYCGSRTLALNPEGELLLGIKIEDRHALESAELTTRVPGIAFAEWGPGDMGFSYGLQDRPPGPYPEVMQRARSRVLAATKAAGIFFLNSVTEEDVEAMIDEGVRIGAANREAAEKGRRHTRRRMPW
jgi:hypothetical protein